MNISIPIPPTESLYYQGTRISRLELPPAEQLAAARATGTLSLVPVQFHGVSAAASAPAMQIPHSFTRTGADALAILRSTTSAPSATAALSQALAPSPRLTPVPPALSRSAAATAAQHTKGPAK